MRGPIGTHTFGRGDRRRATVVTQNVAPRGVALGRPMEQATLDRPAALVSSFPPGPRLPGLVQGFSYARDPLGFFVRLQRRYGYLFSVSFPYFGRVVYVADPDLVKRVFTGDAAQFHAGEANATVLEPA